MHPMGGPSTRLRSFVAARPATVVFLVLLLLILSVQWIPPVGAQGQTFYLTTTTHGTITDCDFNRELGTTPTTAREDHNIPSAEPPQTWCWFSPPLTMNIDTGEWNLTLGLYHLNDGSTNPTISMTVYRADTAGVANLNIMNDNREVSSVDTNNVEFLASNQDVLPFDNEIIRVEIINIGDPQAHTPVAFFGDNGSPGDVNLQTPDERTDPAVSTALPTQIATTSVRLQGNLLIGGHSFANVRFEWGDTMALGNETSFQNFTIDTAYNEDLSGLERNTEYFYRANGTDENGAFITPEGDIVSFFTLAVPPTIETLPAIDIGQSSARLRGQVNTMGDESEFEINWAWREKDVGGFVTTTLTTVSATGVYTEIISGLSPGTTYEFFFRAENNFANQLGDTLEFTTTQPAVRTDAVIDIGITFATLRGAVLEIGESTDVFFEWGDTVSLGNQTTPENVVSLVDFSFELHFLSPGTEYHFRAAGDDMAPGSILTFTTRAIPVEETSWFFRPFTSVIPCAGSSRQAVLNESGDTLVNFGLTTICFTTSRLDQLNNTTTSLKTGVWSSTIWLSTFEPSEMTVTLELVTPDGATVLLQVFQRTFQIQNVSGEIGTLIVSTNVPGRSVDGERVRLTIELVSGDVTILYGNTSGQEGDSRLGLPDRVAINPLVDWTITYGPAWLSLLVGTAFILFIVSAFVKNYKKRRRTGKIWKYMPRRWR